MDVEEVNHREDPFSLAEMREFWDDDVVSVATFSTGTDARDGSECIVGGCGYNIKRCLDHCHIVGGTEEEEVTSSQARLTSQWQMLQEIDFIPRSNKRRVTTYPRNGLLMCKSHHALFDAHFFSIRYIPRVRHTIPSTR